VVERKGKAHQTNAKPIMNQRVVPIHTYDRLPDVATLTKFDFSRIRGEVFVVRRSRLAYHTQRR